MSPGRHPTPDAVEAILAHAAAAPDVEVCGLLVGRFVDGGADVVEARPAANVAAEGRADRYTVDPREILRLEEDLDGTDLALVGVYHSHPHGPPEPSAHDHRNAELWPSFVHAIAGRSDDGGWEVRFFWSGGDGRLRPLVEPSSAPVLSPESGQKPR